MKKLSLSLLVISVPLVAAIFLAANGSGQKPQTRDDSVSISQKHDYSAIAGKTGVAGGVKLAAAHKHEGGNSGKLRIGGTVPNLRFTALDGKSFTLADWKGKLPLIMLADTTCPCVKAYDKRMKALAQKFPDLRVAYVFPSPMESRAQVQKFVTAREYAWPIAYDGDQAVMGALGGSCTTESFLFDRNGILRYHGRIDDNIYVEEKVRARDLENSIQALTDGKRLVKSEIPAYGCVIPQRSKNGIAKTGKGKTT